MEKEYGKVTESQFKRYIAKLPEFRDTMDELPKILARGSEETIREVTEEGMFWAPHYELPDA